MDYFPPQTKLLCYAAITGIAATGATTFSATPVGTAAAISFQIQGKTYTKATISGGTTPTTDAVTGVTHVALAANQGSVWVLGLDSGGNIKAVQGSVESLNSSGTFVTAPQFPNLPDTIAPMAYVVVKAGATASAFAFGTSNWDATGITSTSQAIAEVPKRPQIA